MVIKRKYEWFGVLYEKDHEVKEIVDKAFELYQPQTYLSKEEIIASNYYGIPYFFDMGCGIHGDAYLFIINQLEKLDFRCPYDNGLSLGEVTNIEHEARKDGDAIQLRLVKRVYDMPYRIVGFITINNKNGIPELVDGWDMSLQPSSNLYF